MEDGKLTGIAEIKNIVKTVNGAEADGKTVDVDSLVSVNWFFVKFRGNPNRMTIE